MYTPAKKKGPRTNKPKFEGKLRLRSGDLVRIIAGKDKGKEGRITQVNPVEGTVVVEGLNIVVRHQKPRPQPQRSTITAAAPQPQGGRIETASPLPVGKVQLVDPGDNKSVTRIGMKVDAEGNKTRVARKSGSVIENG